MSLFLLVSNAAAVADNDTNITMVLVMTVIHVGLMMVTRMMTLIGPNVDDNSDSKFLEQRVRCYLVLDVSSKFQVPPRVWFSCEEGPLLRGLPSRKDRPRAQPLRY